VNATKKKNGEHSQNSSLLTFSRSPSLSSTLARILPTSKVRPACLFVEQNKQHPVTTHRLLPIRQQVCRHGVQEILTSCTLIKVVLVAVAAAAVVVLLLLYTQYVE
jgi:hypothetical protein